MSDDGEEALGAFRREARAWLEANYPPSLKDNPNCVTAGMIDGGTPPPDGMLWRKRMGEKGWGVPTWPKRYGGGGLSAAEAAVLREEMNRIGALNPIGGLAVMMFGPTLLEYGTEAQLERHIPPMARMEIRWCQGFSEPGAGSDLASLQTKAEDKGDHFLVTGQKIWTTGAQYSDWCFCLVRTSNQGKKHDGISFLMIDMKSPGVEVRPIVLISGDSPFCETFFTEVKVPKENLVGPLNGGWTVAKRLLQHERVSTSGATPFKVESVTDLRDLAKNYYGVDDDGKIANNDFRTRLTTHLMEERAFRLTAARAMNDRTGGANAVSAVSSILKNAGMKVGQDRAELIVEAMGMQGVGWEGDQFSAAELQSIRQLLHGKAGSIAGGSNEIQNNIIAKRILGLPDPQSAS